MVLVEKKQNINEKHDNHMVLLSFKTGLWLAHNTPLNTHNTVRNNKSKNINLVNE